MRTETQSELQEELALWRSVVCATDWTNDHVIRSVRLLVYLNMRRGPYRESQRFFRQCFKLLPSVFRPQRDLPDLESEVQLLVAMASPAPATVGNLMPVIAELENRQISHSILTVRSVQQAERFTSKARGVVTVDDLVASVPVARRFRALAVGIRRAAHLLKSIQTLAPHFADRLDRRGGVLALDLALAGIYANATRNLLDRLKPRFVLSTGDYWPVDFNLMQAARSMNIPSLVLQHGLMAPFWWPFEADRLAVWGQLFAEEMRRLGAPNEKLILAGMPASDDAFKKRANRAGPSGVLQPFRVLIIANSQSRLRVPHIYSALANLLRAAVPAIPDAQWQVKLHQREDASFFQEQGLSDFPNFTVLPKSTSLASAFAQSNMAVVMYSTAGLEAIQHGLPIVVPALGADVEDNTWWPRYGGGVFVSDAECLVSLVRELRADGPCRSEWLSRQINFLDRSFSHQGKAAAAVVDLILPHLTIQNQAA